MEDKTVYIVKTLCSTVITVAKVAGIVGIFYTFTLPLRGK